MYSMIMPTAWGVPHQPMSATNLLESTDHKGSTTRHGCCKKLLEKYMYLFE